jgi:hypothetical protein
MQLTALYRLHVRPGGDHAATFQYCLDNEVLGTGWGTHWGELEPPDNWDSYLALAQQIWPKTEHRPVIWLHDAPIGSLVWTRSPKGIYYLARLTGEWEYCEQNQAIDLCNIRPAKIVAVEGAEAGVPGAVVRAFSGPGQAFRRVNGDEATRYSEYLFAQLSNEPVPQWRPSLWDILDSLLGPLDVQDLVAAYLQAERGYIALPARQTDSTIAYEYILRDPTDGHLIAVQVKTGDAHIDTETLPNTGGLRWIVFSARKRYPSERPPHVEAIEPDDLISFMRDHPNALPPVADFWLRRVV